MIKCPDCNCTAYSLDGHYMAKLKGQVEKSEGPERSVKDVGNYRACITELYYKYLNSKGLPYKNSTIEIPLCEFKKIVYYY